MYEAPIRLFEQVINAQNIQIENGIMRAVRSYGIDIDKEELIKALRNERDQYSKGYADGIILFAERVVTELLENYSAEYCHWIDDAVYKIKTELLGGY